MPTARESGTAGEGEEDLFGLVVQGVAEQDHLGAGVTGGRFQGFMPHGPGRGFGTVPRVRDRHGDHPDGVQTELPRLVRRTPGDLGGPFLQLMIHHDGTGLEHTASGIESRRGGQGEGIGAATESDEHPQRPVTCGILGLLTTRHIPRQVSFALQRLTQVQAGRPQDRREPPLAAASAGPGARGGGRVGISPGGLRVSGGGPDRGGRGGCGAGGVHRAGHSGRDALRGSRRELRLRHRRRAPCARAKCRRRGSRPRWGGSRGVPRPC